MATLCHSVTGSRLVDLIDVTLACGGANSILVEVVTVFHPLGPPISPGQKIHTLCNSSKYDRDICQAYPFDIVANIDLLFRNVPVFNNI